MLKYAKNNLKLIAGLIFGSLLAGIAVYAISAQNVTYSNSSTHLVASDVRDAVVEINDMVRGNFVSAYKYSTSSSTKCITGEESTCVKTTCYRGVNSRCNAGDIIKYRVNDSNIVTFHVMYNDRDTITMQSQKNTVYNIAWITAADYGSSSASNDKGPLTILTALENATAGWSNVNTQNYESNSIAFNTDLLSSGCSSYNNCNDMTYSMSRKAKARMITVQEANALGCTTSNQSCPKWMNNYLEQSTSYGGTVNDSSHGPNSTHNYGYWTMSAYSGYSTGAWSVYHGGNLNRSHTSFANYGARAVVQVSK